jgi:predicted acetyltransferase
MGNLAVREYEPKDDAGFRHVRAMVYRNGNAVPPEDTVLPDDCIGYVGDLDGEIVAAATAIDMTATKDGTKLRCAGIAAVGVLPERRRGGFGGALMSGISPLMRERGFAVASLYPFRTGFYKKYGYAHCGQRFDISCPSDRLPKHDPEFDAALLPHEKREQIVGCYEAFAARYAGMNIRTPMQWDRVIGQENPHQIYVVGQPVEAYAILRINSDFWVNQAVREFVWSTGRGYRSMLSLFRALGMNKNGVEWREPMDSPYFQFQVEQGADVKVDRGIMYRILDIPTALAAIKRNDSGEFCARVVDKDDPANNSTWHICFGPEGSHAEKGGDPDLEMEIGALTQAFFGSPSLTNILAQGQAKVIRASGMQAAERFFSPANVHCLDFF